MLRCHCHYWWWRWRDDDETSTAATACQAACLSTTMIFQHRTDELSLWNDTKIINTVYYVFVCVCVCENACFVVFRLSVEKISLHSVTPRDKTPTNHNCHKNSNMNKSTYFSELPPPTTNQPVAVTQLKWQLTDVVVKQSGMEGDIYVNILKADNILQSNNYQIGQNIAKHSLTRVFLHLFYGWPLITSGTKSICICN